MQERKTDDFGRENTHIAENRFDIRIDAVVLPDGTWDTADSHEAKCTCVLCTYGAITPKGFYKFRYRTM